jgi:hypothetical protein
MSPAILRISSRIASCIAMVAASGCQSATGPSLEATVARERWEERRPATYQYTVSRSCECLQEMSGPVVVFVDGGTVTRRYVATNAVVSSTYAELFPTIDGLFDIIEDARRRDAASLLVDYDPTYGFPTRVAIDYHPQHVDDEITYRASDFVIPVR